MMANTPVDLQKSEFEFDEYDEYWTPRAASVWNRYFRDCGGGEFSGKLGMLALHGGRLCQAVVSVDSEGAPRLGLSPVSNEGIIHALDLSKALKGQTYKKGLPRLFRSALIELAKLEQRLPQVKGLVSTPYLWHDHSTDQFQLITNAGYHKDSALHLDTDTEFSPYSLHDAKHALEYLVQDFPFETNADRTRFFALILAPLVRPAVQKGVGFTLRKPAGGARTGASLLTEIASRIAKGSPPTTITLPDFSSEESYSLPPSIQRAGTGILVLDNVKEGKPLNSHHLAAAMTSEYWHVRLVGGSTTTAVPVLCTFVATGNDLQLSQELQGRFVRINLDAKQARPGQRGDFAIFDIGSHVVKNQDKYHTAALSLIHHWIESGASLSRHEDIQTLGGFTPQLRILAGILENTGYTERTHMLAGVSESLVDSTDPAVMHLLEIFSELNPELDGTRVMLADIVEYYDQDNERIENSPIADSLLQSDIRNPKQIHGFRNKLARWIKKMEGHHRMKIKCRGGELNSMHLRSLPGRHKGFAMEGTWDEPPSPFYSEELSNSPKVDW